MNSFIALPLLFLLSYFNCLALDVDVKLYCLSRFETVCPMKENNLDSFQQLKCIMQLYESKKLENFDKRCTKLAIGMYQTYHSDTTTASSVKKFDQPSGCSEIGGGGWNGINQLVSNVSFTLVSQCSADRLWMVGEICKRWKGDMVITVSGLNRPISSIEGCDNIKTSLNDSSLQSSVVGSWSNHRVVTILSYNVDISELYPVNKLRNYAICGVRTSHFLYTDIDLWPTSGLFGELRRASNKYPEKFKEPKHATIIAAFQLTREKKKCIGEETESLVRKCNVRDFPNNRTSLINCIKERRCTPMDHLGNPEGHASTNSKKWFRQYRVLRPLPCFRSSRYEPYMVLPTSRYTPLFEEQFKGYGKNKIQHVKHLQAKGFEFSVLPSEFVIHFPHKASEARIAWDIGGKISQQETNNHIYDEYLQWLNMTFNTSSMKTPLCSGVREKLKFSEYQAMLSSTQVAFGSVRKNQQTAKLNTGLL